MPQILILGEWKEISDVAYADDGTVKGFRVKASQLPFVYKGPDVGDFKQWAEAIGVTSAGFALGFLAGPITAIAAGGAAARREPGAGDHANAARRGHFGRRGARGR